MFRHFCPNLVSRNSTATTISMHLCIVSFANRGEPCEVVTPPPKSDRDLSRSHVVSTTCRTQKYSNPPQGVSTHLISYGRSYVVDRVCQESESRNRKIDSRQSHTGSDIASPRWTMHHVRPP